MSNNYREHDNKEFDVDTGTYMEDTRSNDLIGIDSDGNGLIDNVEELIEDADERAAEYNAERERLEKEKYDEVRRQEQDEKDEEQDSFSLSR